MNCELCRAQPAQVKVIVTDLEGKVLDEKALCRECAVNAPSLEVE